MSLLSTDRVVIFSARILVVLGYRQLGLDQTHLERNTLDANLKDLVLVDQAAIAECPDTVGLPAVFLDLAVRGTASEIIAIEPQHRFSRKVVVVDGKRCVDAAAAICLDNHGRQFSFRQCIQQLASLGGRDDLLGLSVRDGHEEAIEVVAVLAGAGTGDEGLVVHAVESVFSTMGVGLSSKIKVSVASLHGHAVDLWRCLVPCVGEVGLGSRGRRGCTQS